MPGRVKRRDPIELQIELALSPGVFIRDRACYSFVSSLEGVVAEINALLASDAERAIAAFRIFSHLQPVFVFRLWAGADPAERVPDGDRRERNIR